MEKKNTKHSDDNKDALTHEERYIDFAKQFAKKFNFLTSSSQHTRTVDGKETSSSSAKNNPDADFMNQLKQFENNLVYIFLRCFSRVLNFFSSFSWVLNILVGF